MTGDEAAARAEADALSEPRLRRWRSTGLDLAYLDWGPTDAPPVVLVHGAEGLLVDRAVERLVGLAREVDP